MYVSVLGDEGDSKISDDEADFLVYVRDHSW